MTKIEILEEWSVCGDCLQFIANDDTTGLSYYYSDDEVDEKIADMQRGLDGLEDGRYAVASGEDLGFCRSSCDCCGSYLHGDRYLINILGTIAETTNL